MIGYTYITEELAITARKQCADYYGLPKTPTSTTLYKVNYSEAYLNTPKFWYINFDESIRVVLGQPKEFNIITGI
jgi:hypothetical protein